MEEMSFMVLCGLLWFDYVHLPFAPEDEPEVIE